MNLYPNPTQVAIMALIDETRISMQDARVQDNFMTSPTRALRDNCTLGLQLPQRAGKTMLLQTWATSRDVVMVNSEKKRWEFIDELVGRGDQPKVVTLGGLGELDQSVRDRIHTIYVTEPWWDRIGVDSMHYYHAVVAAFSRPVLSVFLDSPYTKE